MSRGAAKNAPAQSVDEELIDEFLENILDILRPQLDGRNVLSPTQHRQLQNEAGAFVEALQKKSIKKLRGREGR
jgi:hypothetical protein